jgi:hypothetical protein
MVTSSYACIKKCETFPLQLSRFQDDYTPVYRSATRFRIARSRGWEKTPEGIHRHSKKLNSNRFFRCPCPGVQGWLYGWSFYRSIEIASSFTIVSPINAYCKTIRTTHGKIIRLYFDIPVGDWRLIENINAIEQKVIVTSKW